MLGTGEEMVYIDVDAFLEEEIPAIAVRGISNPQNLVSARFVDGFEQPLGDPFELRPVPLAGLQPGDLEPDPISSRDIILGLSQVLGEIR